jgi:predicted site-specific integrase-resolvase
MAQLEEKAQETLELATKITTCGILILNEEDKTDVDDKIKQLKEYVSTMSGKAHGEFNR